MYSATMYSATTVISVGNIVDGAVVTTLPVGTVGWQSTLTVAGRPDGFHTTTTERGAKAAHVYLIKMATAKLSAIDVAARTGR